jgi:hypothetical protein
MFKKKIEFSEKDAALKEMLAARNELERARQMFNYATNEYFEIANTELTIAELKYNVAFTKLKKLCADKVDLPSIGIIHSYELA